MTPRAARVACTALALGLWLASARAGDGALDEPLDKSLDVTSGEFRAPMVELYTSEGCSSCPPADDWLRRFGRTLGRDFNAVPLAFHVDYWNYLGWNDPYSRPSFSKRQRRIPATRRRGGGIYTPELVVDGREARGGDSILRAVQKANSQKAAATIRVRVANRDSQEGVDNVRARIAVDNRSEANDAHAYVAIYESGIVRKIGAGENRGRTLKHDFVVRHWSRPIVIRRGANHADVDVAIPADWKRPNLGLAVVVVDRHSGATLQAVRTPLASLFSG